MNAKDSSRRAFLSQSGTVLGAAWLSMTLPSMLRAAENTWGSRVAGSPLKVLTETEAAELDAITGQIYPTDDTPGAREIGVVNFIDASLETFNAPLAGPIRAALADVQAKTEALFPGRRLISELGHDDQLAVMKTIESESYFGVIRLLTLVGLFSHPSYGGNRDRLGWKAIGFDDRHAWLPPFGYYDANYVEEG